MLAKCTRSGLLAMILLSTLFFLQGQNCPSPTLQNGTFLHGNNIRALYAASGSQFWDGENSQFSAESPLSSINTIFAQGLWFSAFDQGGNLRLSAASYGAGSGDSDYYPGPLMEDGTTNTDDCSNYDRAWDVYRYQILAHLDDFADNGIIDSPIPAVVGWPGRGNPEFEAITDFALPDTPQGFAPFWDLDQDGIYEPLSGEYPIESRHEIIPEHMVYTVFNNVGNTSTDSGSSFRAITEIHCLAWALNCTDNGVLNNTIFSSYRFINRDVEQFDSLRIGIWDDFDLGCFVDDLVGSAPELNTFFAYNSDNNDEVNCTGGVIGAGENPPAQAVTFLNHSLDAFISTNNSGFGNPLPPTTDPETAIEYYNYLSGRFRDGTPVTEGGSGYDPESDEIVSHIFPGDPNDPEAWSAFREGLFVGDFRSIGSTLFETWNPGQVIELDIAHSYYREEGANFLDNVSEMYIGVAELQNLYDSNFSEACTPPMLCEEDCIWSGDLNADGIANHEDAIALGFGLNNTGVDRSGPYNWTPQIGDSWGGIQIFGTDPKHLDADGNGTCSPEDLEYTERHYNLTRPDYEATVTYPIGDELELVRTGGNTDFTELSPGEFFLARVNLAADIEDLRAIAFTVEYDPIFFNQFTALNLGSWSSDFAILNDDVSGLIDFGLYETDPENSIQSGTLIPIQIRIRNDFPADFPTDETQIRFRNVRGFLSDGTEIDLGAAEVMVQIDGVVATDEPAWALGLNIFPNPVQDRLTIQTGSATIEEIHVLGSNGRRLIQTINKDDEIDVKDLPSGVYFVRMFSQGDFVVRKFVKQ